ncbi:MAG: V-type ATP synthase subunit A [Anaerolineales bacterium]|nr:V-type ATP synthase subunit A [Anaerolineales bacterium]
MMNETHTTGKIVRIAGPVVRAAGLDNIRLYDVARVGEIGLIGEVIRLSEGLTTIQVYEDTSGIRVGEPVYNTGYPLVAYLGPGLLGQVYDGLQRPLNILAEQGEEFIQRGVQASPLPAEKRWHFTPRVSEGDLVEPGDILGVVQESRTIEHRIMMPPNARGRVTKIREGELKVDEVAAVVRSEEAGGEIEVTLAQRWPVRQPRPSRMRLAPREPMMTGTRIIDSFFPIAKGGAAIIPGGFGTGKTITEHSLARWAEADVVVYVGCGERGNEMTEVLEEFPKLEDPRTGAKLMERTVLIANTSNMPVAAREASIYTGITIAEYYRDMGYDVLMLADSTSRWGEALREISGRLEEMPGEEGYPAYLAARLAEFYERAGRVDCIGNRGGESDNDARTGSVSIVGAVSPPGGDFSEPVTQNSMRVASTFWALDYNLSRRRHFPAINWTNSYSLYDFKDWFEREVADDWNELTQEAMALLQREVELLEIVQLVGPDALAEPERAILATARMLREDFLQQSSFHEVDRYCMIQKSYWMLKAIMDFHRLTQAALERNVPLSRVTSMPVIPLIARMKEFPAQSAEADVQELMSRVRQDFSTMGVN